jgi:hypothetical protein
MAFAKPMGVFKANAICRIKEVSREEKGDRGKLTLAGS